MTFVAKSSSMSDYKTWLASAQQTPQQLTLQQYNQLAKPSQYNAVATYSNVSSGLYASVINKYMPYGMMSGMTQ
jgi:cytochrome o ubiquinol oxidase subunit 2